MQKDIPVSKNVDEYISTYPEDVQTILQKIRATIKKAAPKAEERISYGIPTYTMQENLVHFGGFKKHIGFFPTASGVEAFKDELKDYETSKGTVQFPLNKPIPYKLITEIVKFRVLKSAEKAVLKTLKKISKKK